jgi:hypothetical protein
MSTNGPAALAIIALALTIAAVAILLEGQQTPTREARACEFQGLVGGLGLGPAVDLSRCAFSFDPRLCRHCPADVGPIPGGGCFCAEHGCSILYYRALQTAP